MSTPIAPLEHRRRGEVGVYGLWQLRDYLIDRGLPTVIVCTLFGYLTVAPGLPRVRANLENLPQSLIDKWGGVDGATAMLMRDFNEGFLRSFLGVVIFLGALFAMNGIVANDRKQGFYRFLFAKPITPMRYYGQAFLINWTGFIAVATGLALVYGALVWPILTWPLVVVLALMSLTYAGIAFALSATARWDWLSLFAVTVLASYVWETFGESTAALAQLRYLLPPLNRTAEIYAAVGKEAPLDWPLLQWFGAYGIACYVIGLVVLRYRRLAIV